MYYVNYKHPSSFVEEVWGAAAPQEIVLDCTYGSGGHFKKLANKHCKVCAIDCDIAALVSGYGHVCKPLLKVKVNLCKPMYDIVVIDAGVSLAQAKCYWRRFSKARVSSAVVGANTLMLFRRVACSLKAGGKLLVMVYGFEFALLASKLNETAAASALYLLNRAFVHSSCAERTLRRCCSYARLLMFIKTK
ncbi:MAG: hypothetical protein AAI978_00475 [Candidatus Hodgkinia cicadicola]